MSVYTLVKLPSKEIAGNKLPVQYYFYDKEFDNTDVDIKNSISVCITTFLASIIIQASVFKVSIELMLHKIFNDYPIVKVSDIEVDPVIINARYVNNKILYKISKNDKYIGEINEQDKQV